MRTVSPPVSVCLKRVKFVLNNSLAFATGTSTLSQSPAEEMDVAVRLLFDNHALTIETVSGLGATKLLIYMTISSIYSSVILWKQDAAHLLLGQVPPIRFTVWVANAVESVNQAIRVALGKGKAKVERRLRRSRANLRKAGGSSRTQLMNAESRRRERACGGDPSKHEGQKCGRGKHGHSTRDKRNPQGVCAGADAVLWSSAWQCIASADQAGSPLGITGAEIKVEIRGDAMVMGQDVGHIRTLWRISAKGARRVSA